MQNASARKPPCTAYLERRITAMMTAPSKTIPLATPEDTLALGARLAAVLKSGDIIALTGDLGAGKTTLSRGLIQSICGAIDVPSPTYTLLQTYPAEGFEIYHFDFYRLGKPEDCLELGLDDALDFGASLMEWPERLGRYLPEDNLSVDMAFEGEGRIAKLIAGPSWEARVNEL